MRPAVSAWSTSTRTDRSAAGATEVSDLRVAALRPATVSPRDAGLATGTGIAEGLCPACSPASSGGFHWARSTGTADRCRTRQRRIAGAVTVTGGSTDRGWLAPQFAGWPWRELFPRCIIFVTAPGRLDDPDRADQQSCVGL